MVSTDKSRDITGGLCGSILESGDPGSGNDSGLTGEGGAVDVAAGAVSVAVAVADDDLHL